MLIWFILCHKNSFSSLLLSMHFFVSIFSSIIFLLFYLLVYFLSATFLRMFLLRRFFNPDFICIFTNKLLCDFEVSIIYNSFSRNHVITLSYLFANYYLLFFLLIFENLLFSSIFVLILSLPARVLTHVCINDFFIFF